MDKTLFINVALNIDTEVYSSVFAYVWMIVLPKQYRIIWVHQGGIDDPLSLRVARRLANDNLLLRQSIPLAPVTLLE